MARTSSLDLVGSAFNRWLVIDYSHEKKPHHYYVCRCQCGAEAVVQANSLKSGTSRSCGCHRREASRERRTTHGASRHPAYQSWSAMRRRCYDPKFEGFNYYGAVGIKVCEAWMTFEGFWSDMGDTWAAGLSIDRLDCRGNYEPSNCRWATPIEQANNKSNNHVIDTPWGKMSIADAARAAGLTYGALKHRIERNWPTRRLFQAARVN